jgi:hypothetical protein
MIQSRGDDVFFGVSGTHDGPATVVGVVRTAEAEVNLGYFFHNSNAGGSQCTATLASGRWSVTRCGRAWVS